MSEIKFRLRHTMLPVRDLDRSIQFYTGLLGMDIMRLRQQDEKTRVGYLGYGSEDEGPALELVQSGGTQDSVQIPSWSGHIAIMVSDLYGLCETLKAAGVTFSQEPHPNRPGSRDHMAYIQDADGYGIELNERHTLTGPPLKRSGSSSL
ncbi:MAG: lactoylglutathione lyase [Deltaproteobacteria bacterium]|nr:lactoylglutathione lyase [Deltaproteobacteria bacterium]